MKDIIYLVCDRAKVLRMTKSLPSLHRGEIPVKLNVTVENGAFREPVIEREVNIVDWRDGVDIADVQFNEATITEEEAAIIRAHRLERMREILEEQGYQIIGPTSVDEMEAGHGIE